MPMLKTRDDGAAGGVLSRLAAQRRRLTLVIHRGDDQVVPIDAAGRLSAKAVKEAELKVYGAASHGLFQTHQEQFNADLLEFVKG